LRFGIAKDFFPTKHQFFQWFTTHMIAWPSPFGFLRRLFHRFAFGDTIPNGLSHVHPVYNSRLRCLTFQLHWGPSPAAVEAARELDKALFVYIYCEDNALCARAETLFREAPVADAIASAFVFYALPITTAEGYSLDRDVLPLAAADPPRPSDRANGRRFDDLCNVPGRSRPVVTAFVSWCCGTDESRRRRDRKSVV
jgi:hypothetical protein